MHKIDNKREPTVQFRELHSMLCGDINGKETQKRKGICICIHAADSLCWTAENNNTVKQLHSNFFLMSGCFKTSNISVSTRIISPQGRMLNALSNKNVHSILAELSLPLDDPSLLLSNTHMHVPYSYLALLSTLPV